MARLTVSSGLLYFTTHTENNTEQTKVRLEKALGSFLEAVGETEKPQCLYRFYHEYSRGSDAVGLESDAKILTLPGSVPSLAFNDASLGPVNEAWKVVMGPAAEDADAEYMKFSDREGAEEYDDDYE